MARNYFNRGDAMDVIGAGQAGWDDTDARINGIMERRSSVQAGRQLATGDRAGAAATFARGGYIQPARALAGDQREEEDRQTERSAAQQKASAAQVAERVRILTGVANHLLTVPEGQRVARLKEAYPLFQMAGLDTAMFDGLTEDQLTNGAIQSFTGEVQKQAEQYTLAPGARRFDVGGKLIAENPTAEKPTIVPQGATVLGADRKPVFTNPKTFAPRRPASGGGGASGLPPGYVPR
jgi:hypothetical protein